MSTPKTNLPTGLNKKFKFVQKPDDDFACIKLLEGKYKDVVYKHNHIKFAPEPDDNGEIPLKFNYDVLGNPNQAKVDTQDFMNYIGDILLEVVQYQLDNGTLQFNE